MTRTLGWLLVAALIGCTGSLTLDPPEDAALSAADARPDAAQGGGDGSPATDLGALPDAEPTEPDLGPSADMAPPPVDMAPPPVDMAPPPVDMAPPPVDMAPPPPAPLDCRHLSTTFGEPRVELDVGPNAADRLTFRVGGLPDPALVDNATLLFESYDADHPGQEGRIFVNGQGPYDLPADADWDNLAQAARVDVTGDVVAGRNVIEFAPGPLERSYFGVANVELSVRARVAACDEAPPPPEPPADAVRREIRYPQAQYTNRTTWVLGCEDNGARAYAFTASGDEHVPTDCEGIYRAGGNRRGDAIFRFDDVVEAEYEIVIRSRHTENRSPAGALFLVDGEGRRISQRSDRGFTNDTWGRRRLSGRVDVILRAEGNSDSVIFVRLEPVSG